MSWSSGTYTKGNSATGGWTGDQSSGIGIEAGRHDTQDNDFATGINNCIAKDGQNTPTANLPMGGYKHTGVANASASNEYVAFGQVVAGVGEQSLALVKTIDEFGNDAAGAEYRFRKSRNAAIGGNTIVTNGDSLGQISFYGNNGTGYTQAAGIGAIVSGVPGASNDMPGALQFFTTPDGTGSWVERARIAPTGYVGIGNNAPGTILDIAENVNGGLQVRSYNANAGSSAATILTLGNDASVSGGQVRLNSSTNASLSGANSLMLYNGIAGGTIGLYAAGNERLRIGAGGTVTMSAYGAGTATFSAAGVISSVSDENLKIKDGPITDAIEKIKKLEPGYWFWKPEAAEDLGTQRELGFFAQNVNEAIGEEAAPTPQDGKNWGLYDRSVLAVVVQAMKDYAAYIKTLEARIEALENA